MMLQQINRERKQASKVQTKYCLVTAFLPPDNAEN